MTDAVRVYKCDTDELVPVTQKWCDDAQSGMNKLAKRNEIIKMIVNLNIVRDAVLIDDLHTILWKNKSP